MKVALSLLTKDRQELTRQVLPRVTMNPACDLHIIDASANVWRPASKGGLKYYTFHSKIRGGADGAIVYALTMMLEHEADYTHVGLIENDVLPAYGWLGTTMALFEKGQNEGLSVGAVSPRCYVDRVLLQRDGYAVCHNLGAGIVLFTREAAQLILKFYRTGWWHDNRAVFGQLSGLDIGRWGCFRGNEQWTTADWHFDAVLAQHGLASLALTPSPVDMIGQEPSLEEQGLMLAREPVEERRDDLAFATFQGRTASIRSGAWKPDTIKPIHQHMGMQTHFAHQLTNLEFQRGGDWRLQWSQGFGPFAYRANTESKMCLMLFGPVTFLVSGGKHGAKVTIRDTDSGYEISPELPAGEQQIAQLQVPGGMSYCGIVMTCAPGAVFYGVQTSESQPVTSSLFDYHSLPPV